MSHIRCYPWLNKKFIWHQTYKQSQQRCRKFWGTKFVSNSRVESISLGRKTCSLIFTRALWIWRISFYLRVENVFPVRTKNTSTHLLKFLTLIVRKLYFDLNCFCHLRTHRGLGSNVFLSWWWFIYSNISILYAENEVKQSQTNLKSHSSVCESYIKLLEIAWNIFRSPQTDTSDYIYGEKKNSLNYTCAIARAEVWIQNCWCENQIAIKIEEI